MRGAPGPAGGAQERRTARAWVARALRPSLSRGLGPPAAQAGMFCASAGPPPVGRDVGGAARGRREEQHLVEPVQARLHEAR
jgi:hypothetical protein